MLPLGRAVRSGLHVARLVTLYGEASERAPLHGAQAVMRAQAEAPGLPMSLYPTTPLAYLPGIGKSRRLR